MLCSSSGGVTKTFGRETPEVVECSERLDVGEPCSGCTSSGNESMDAFMAVVRGMQYPVIGEKKEKIQEFSAPDRTQVVQCRVYEGGEVGCKGVCGWSVPGCGCDGGMRRRSVRRCGR